MGRRSHPGAREDLRAWHSGTDSQKMQVLVLIALTFILTANKAAGFTRLGAGTACCGAWAAFRREGSGSVRALRLMGLLRQVGAPSIP
jgi:hypothetical protein